ncbi:MAG TPA: ABC transporter ATP-binding protein [Acetobacteraceae bacterium]|nr:ABC transporter ATP-binding protein [Acetobacteraceae bacterium]
MVQIADPEPVSRAVPNAVSEPPFVEFRDVDKSFDGRVLAVRSLNLRIARGEFLTLLGPSGSGKTTTLNMLAGFERPVRGSITLDGRPVDRLPPYERNIGMVFQNYALFPHMTVAENVAFPLSVRRVRKHELRERVRRALAMVRLDDYMDRRPAQLSGGQQQRVALARALVFEPSLVLMDEPLGALDRKLREHMQIELKQLHDMLGVTIVYVTHDQAEALTMSDRIAVFRNGTIVQLGTPEELYNAPADAFVASFIGENNLLDGVVAQIDGDTCHVRLDGGVSVAASAKRLSGAGPVQVAVRPERVRFGEGAVENSFAARVESRIYLGDHQHILTRLPNGHLITVKAEAALSTTPGQTITLHWAAADCWAFAADENISETRGKA